ncbi:hypothetical protein CCH79_00014142, partial [Gambusia affinis]
MNPVLLLVVAVTVGGARATLSRCWERMSCQELISESSMTHDKKDIPYKMKHFRWSGPVAGKRYGGFMKSWQEHSKRPLITLFRNVINKEGEEEKRA